MVGEISRDELKEKLKSGEEVQIIDIRDEEAFARGHIPGAENVPMPELPARVDEIHWADTVVVACPIGQSSIQAARLIESYERVGEETEVLNLTGGYDGWDGDLETDG